MGKLFDDLRNSQRQLKEQEPGYAVSLGACISLVGIATNDIEQSRVLTKDIVRFLEQLFGRIVHDDSFDEELKVLTRLKSRAEFKISDSDRVIKLIIETKEQYPILKR